ncbi:EF-hand domain-containing protein [Haematococcus lacustris]|uniref:EF-hand domain-containing protein n=1 Tax=Haematococcus lacustris TaxID=44745 RepID=A0A699ZD50_HAELA|nr:EF-hand domain-containing protein [Haematococcus lacustris]
MLAWAGLRKTLIHDNDQTGLYQWIRGQPAEVDGQKRFVQLHAGETPFRLGLLSVSMLLNGYSYFIPKLNVYQNVSALGIHLTWVPLSREGKFHRMRDGMLYNDEPEYYSGPQFITAVPPGYNEMRDTEAMIKIHLAKMEVQLKQMYRAMAIAVIMNRTLVLPKLQCFCYKNWAMSSQLPGVQAQGNAGIPGDRATVYPMECQLDQSGCGGQG